LRQYRDMDSDNLATRTETFPLSVLENGKVSRTVLTDPVTDPVKRLLHLLDTEESSSQLREALNVCSWGCPQVSK